jgi:hypothetical protein
MNQEALDALTGYFQSFADKVVSRSKGILNSAKGTTRLGDSIRAEVTYDESSQIISTKFYMLNYGTYVNQGVSGDHGKNAKTYTDWRGNTVKSDFTYRDKMPPPSIIEQWIKNKGIKGRKSLKKYRKNKKSTVKGAGQFIKDRSLAFAIAKSIKIKGIEGISFFTQPFGEEFKTMKENMLPVLARQIKDMYLTTFTK